MCVWCTAGADNEQGGEPRGIGLFATVPCHSQRDLPCRLHEQQLLGRYQGQRHVLCTVQSVDIDVEIAINHVHRKHII